MVSPVRSARLLAEPPWRDGSGGFIAQAVTHLPMSDSCHMHACPESLCFSAFWESGVPGIFRQCSPAGPANPVASTYGPDVLEHLSRLQ